MASLKTRGSRRSRRSKKAPKALPALAARLHARATDVTGFVVNVHDAVNFDIDLDLDPERRRFYSAAISAPYSYADEELGKGRTTGTGIAYRCRLRGVGLECEEKGGRRRAAWPPGGRGGSKVEVTRLIDRAGGWVRCKVSDIDMYDRILVDISVSAGPPDCGTMIDLRDALLSSQYSSMFFTYVASVCSAPALGLRPPAS